MNKGKTTWVISDYYTVRKCSYFSCKQRKIALLWPIIKARRFNKLLIPKFQKLQFNIQLRIPPIPPHSLPHRFSLSFARKWGSIQLAPVPLIFRNVKQFVEGLGRGCWISVTRFIFGVLSVKIWGISQISTLFADLRSHLPINRKTRHFSPDSYNHESCFHSMSVYLLFTCHALFFPLITRHK